MGVDTSDGVDGCGTVSDSSGDDDGEHVIVVLRIKTSGEGGDIEVDVCESDYDGGSGCGGDVRNDSNDCWG